MRVLFSTAVLNFGAIRVSHVSLRCHVPLGGVKSSFTPSPPTRDDSRPRLPTSLTGIETRSDLKNVISHRVPQLVARSVLRVHDVRLSSRLFCPGIFLSRDRSSLPCYLRDSCLWEFPFPTMFLLQWRNGVTLYLKVLSTERGLRHSTLVSFRKVKKEHI